MMQARSQSSARRAPVEDGGVRWVGPAWHRRVRGLHVLKVKGSFREMGRQHGALLRDAIPGGPIPYFRAHVERLFGRSLGPLQPLAPLLFAALRRTVGRKVARSLPDFARETALGIAEGAGLPIEPFVDGCVMPDSLLWALSRYIELTGHGPAVAHRAQLGLGCTSAFAWGEATVDGKLYHARNFDYHGLKVWPDSAAVVFHEPDRGQRYVAVTAAGVGLGGTTAMNQAGLSLTVHQHMFTGRTRLGGIPIGTMGDVVMREAETLEDAERILGATRPIGCWTYLIADGKRREVLCWEENPDRQVARRVASPEASTFAYSNIYLDDELGATEADLYGSYWRNNAARLARARQLLATRSSPLDAAGMAAILADASGPCRVSESISMIITTASVVFRPEDGVVWVATGDAPVSRNAYVPFGLGAGDHAPEHGEIAALPRDAAAEAFSAYARAYVAYLDRHDLAEARGELARALDGAPGEPAFHAVAGIVALEAGDAAAAEGSLSRAIEIGHAHPQRVAGFHLWRGRARDRLGRREDAMADYRAALARPADPPVRAAALKGARRPYRGSRPGVDFVLGDVAVP
jgi:tetratricopeptide (TPR) repeat protein